MSLIILKAYLLINIINKTPLAGFYFMLLKIKNRRIKMNNYYYNNIKKRVKNIKRLKKDLEKIKGEHAELVKAELNSNIYDVIYFKNEFKRMIKFLLNKKDNKQDHSYLKSMKRYLASLKYRKYLVK